MEVNTVVIGAGVSGVHASLRLKKAGIEHLVLEKNPEPLWGWKTERWDSFKMNTPHWCNQLFDQEDDVEKTLVGLDLKTNLAHWNKHVEESKLPIHVDTEVISVRRSTPEEKARFVVEWKKQGGSTGIYFAKNVVACPGALQTPKYPAVAESLPDGIKSFNIATYKSPSQLADGATLVVGAGQTGVQIADELVKAGKKVFMATSRVKGVPRKVRGIDHVHIIKVTGMSNMTKDMFPEDDVYSKPPMVGAEDSISYHSLFRSGVKLLGRLESITPDGKATFGDDLASNVEFSDQTHEMYFGIFSQASAGSPEFKDAPPPEADPAYEKSQELLAYAANPIQELDLNKEGITNVFWACGLSADFPWLNIDPVRNAFGKTGIPVETCVAEVPGFYWIGFPFQRNFFSSFLGGFGDDAGWIVEQIQGKPIEE